MFKIIWLTRLSRDRPRDEVRQQWIEVHGPHFAALPGLLGYTQNEVSSVLVAEDGGENEPAWDGYACAWWADKAAFEASMATPEWGPLMDEAVELFDMSWVAGKDAVVDELTVKEWTGGSAPQCKLAFILRFRKDLSREEARQYWAEHHASLALAIKQTGASVQSHVVEPPGGSPDSLPIYFDGLSESWFADRPAFDEAAGSAAWAALIADSPNLFDQSFQIAALVEERIVKALPAS